MGSSYKDTTLGKIVIDDAMSYLSFSIELKRPNSIGGYNNLTFNMHNGEGGENILWLYSYDKSDHIVGTQLLGQEHFSAAQAKELRKKLTEAIGRGLPQSDIEKITRDAVAMVGDERLQTHSLSQGEFITKNSHNDGIYESGKAKDGESKVDIMAVTTDHKKNHLSIELEEAGRLIGVAFVNGGVFASVRRDALDVNIIDLSDSLDATEIKQIKELANKITSDGYLSNVEGEQI